MDMNDLSHEFEETPWIYPLVSKGTIDIMDIAEIIAAKTGQDAEKLKEYIRQYNKAALKYLKEGDSVEYFGIGTLYPNLDDDGNLIDVHFEASETFLKEIEDNRRRNPSLN